MTAAVCLFAPLGPYGAPGLDFAAGMGKGFREEIRAFFEKPGRARADFQAQAGEFAPVILWHGEQDTSPPPAHSRWFAEHVPHVTAHFPADEDHTNVEENNRGSAFAWLKAHL